MFVGGTILDENENEGPATFDYFFEGPILDINVTVFLTVRNSSILPSGMCLIFIVNCRVNPLCPPEQEVQSNGAGRGELA